MVKFEGANYGGISTKLKWQINKKNTRPWSKNF